MRRLFTISCLYFFAVVSIIAQQVDPLLSQTIEKNRTHMREVRAGRVKATKPTPITLIDSEGNTTVLDGKHVVNGIDTMAMKELINILYSPTGEISWLSVIGTLKEGADCPLTQLEAIGVKVTCRVGNIVCMSVPAEAWDRLSQMSEFERLGADKLNHLDNDATRTKTGAAYVTGEKTGAALPDTKYTGAGVVVGIVDTGIDFNHASFRDPKTGDTRIKEAMIFTGSTITPKLYKTPAAIEALTTGTAAQTHGSHTAATVAGSNIPGLDCRGIAPEADLVLCDLNTLYDTQIIASLDKIFHYADSVHKPAVVNLSLGSHYFPYNASNRGIQQVCTTLTENGEKSGHVICFSAGNEATNKLGLSKTLVDGKLKTTVKTNIVITYKSVVYPAYQSTDIVVYNVGGSPFTVQLKAMDMTDHSIHTLTDLVYNFSLQKLTLSNPYSSYSWTNDGLKYNRVNINPGNFFIYNANYRLILEVSGTPGDEIRILDVNGGSNMTFLGEDDDSSLAGYTSSHGEMSISDLACNDAVLSVGAWTGNQYFKSLDGYLRYSKDLKQDYIANFSSFGKDDHGIARPDILAPGVWINSAINLYNPSYFTNGNLNTSLSNYTSLTGFANVTLGTKYTRNNGVGAMSGTSMSCPVASGIIALWLQANPNLSVKQIRAMLTDNALNDKYTTDTKLIPSGDVVQAGKGKIDALRGIKQILGTDTYPMDETITISDARLATFSSRYPLNFASTAAPKAYNASTFNGEQLTFSRQTGQLAANTGLLLSAPAGTYKIPIATSGNTLSANLLHGTANAAETFNTAAEIYVLSQPAGKKLGFYPNGAGLTVSQGKAYLKFDSTTPTVKELTFTFDDDIHEADDELHADAIIVDVNSDNFFVTDDSPTSITPNSKLLTTPKESIPSQANV